MTKQTKNTIAAQDIIGVETTCAKCKCIVSRPMGSFQNNLSSCPNCGHTWMPHRDSLINLSEIVTRLGMLASLPIQNPPPAIGIRFEIAQDKEA